MANRISEFRQFKISDTCWIEFKFNRDNSDVYVARSLNIARKWIKKYNSSKFTISLRSRIFQDGFAIIDTSASKSFDIKKVDELVDLMNSARKKGVRFFI